MASASFPSCRPEFNWMLSSNGWNPCRLATPLITNCDKRATPLPAINSGEHYQAPTELTQNPCICSNVVYALISACSLCQNGNTYTWKDWTEKCVKSFPLGRVILLSAILDQQVFAAQIPAWKHTYCSVDGLSIPAWANFNGLYQSQFDIVRASVYANGVPNTLSPLTTPTAVVIPPAAPDAVTSTQIVTAAVTVQTTIGAQTAIDTTSNPTSANIPTSSPSSPTVTDLKVVSIVTTSITATTGTDTKVPFASVGGSGVQTPVTQTPSAVASSEASKISNKGGIVGGVIGGLLFLAVITGVVFWWLKRRQRSRVAPSAAYIAARGAPQRTPSMGQSPFQDQAASSAIIVPYVSPFADEKRGYNFSDYSRVQRAPSPTLP